MILLSAVIAGFLAGLVRAWCTGQRMVPPRMCQAWLVPIAFVPQLLAFYLLPASKSATDPVAAAALISSQAALLVFVWSNRDQCPFWLMGLGLAMNLSVIALNGGLMPISPETAVHLAPNASPDAWQVGHRLGNTKDIVLSVPDTRLWWLSDRFLTPTWFPGRVAFSLGDVLIAGGTFWLLWASGGRRPLRGCQKPGF